MKSSAGRLPIKWLALESMTNQTYTSQSDVYVNFYYSFTYKIFINKQTLFRWSYGILLYEIVTLGGTPYPTVPVDCLVDYLKSGNRMSRPHNCSQELYDLWIILIREISKFSLKKFLAQFQVRFNVFMLAL